MWIGLIGGVPSPTEARAQTTAGPACDDETAGMRASVSARAPGVASCLLSSSFPRWFLNVDPAADEAGWGVTAPHQPPPAYVARINARDPRRAAEAAGRRARAGLGATARTTDSTAWAR